MAGRPGKLGRSLKQQKDILGRVVRWQGPEWSRRLRLGAYGLPTAAVTGTPGRMVEHLKLIVSRFWGPGIELKVPAVVVPPKGQEGESVDTCPPFPCGAGHLWHSLSLGGLDPTAPHLFVLSVKLGSPCDAQPGLEPQRLQPSSCLSLPRAGTSGHPPLGFPFISPFSCHTGHVG